jgi:hypothetical protein
MTRFHAERNGGKAGVFNRVRRVPDLEGVLWINAQDIELDPPSIQVRPVGG